MRVLIVEDEPRAAKRLGRLIKKYNSEASIIAVCPSVEAAVHTLSSEKHPDLIFLDVQLEDGECFQLFDRIAVTSPVVFSTAHADYALRAFAVNAIDYLLKPLVERELEHTLMRCAAMRQGSYAPAVWRAASLASRETHTKLARFQQQFLIRAGERFLPISVSDIHLLEAHMKGVRLHVQNGSSWHLEEGLADVASRLDPEAFVRVSRSAIVKLEAVIALERVKSGYQITLKGGELKVPVSRANVSSFKERLGS